jgi:ubiquinone/menaquinone biosynthesis C-methylase UbiE
MVPAHGFTAVDQQADPEAWVALLDKLSAEPFYAAYKKRSVELLEPRDGASYLDLGAGTGGDARLIKAQAKCSVVAADRSLTMAMACRARGGVLALVCDAADLPFPEMTFDGCRADRTLQHLQNPELAVAEMVRVTKAGGRVIAVDPDYGTQVMELPDQALARCVLRYRADHMLRNGAIAHRAGSIFRDAGLSSVQVETITLVVRDPRAVDNVMGLRTWARTAAANGFLAPEDAERYEALFDETVRAERFLYSLIFFITSGMKVS